MQLLVIIHADLSSTSKKWSTSRNLSLVSFGFSSCFLLQIQDCPKNIMIIWGINTWYLSLFPFLILMNHLTYFSYIILEKYSWMVYDICAWLRREILHSYGFEHMGTLNNLEKAGFFRKQVCGSYFLWYKLLNQGHYPVLVS